jgi:hypothetical protein
MQRRGAVGNGRRLGMGSVLTAPQGTAHMFELPGPAGHVGFAIAPSIRAGSRGMLAPLVSISGGLQGVA